MKKLATHQDLVENEGVTLPANEDICDETGVTVLLRDLDPQRTYNVMSPRLAHPEEAKDFVHDVIEEAPDASL